MSRDAGEDPYIRTLRAALVAEHEATIAEVQRAADEAATRGDEPGRKWHQERADRLRAIPYPWEHKQAAA